jgi:uncharacterized membrane protein YqhA
MLGRIIMWSRYLVIIAILGSFIAAVVVLVYGGLGVLGIIRDAFAHSIFTEAESKRLAVECIDLIDLFFLGIVLYIVALGLYELFIDEHLPTPAWLIVPNLEDLKGKLLGVIIVLLAVTFLANVVEWNGGTAILALGIAIGLIIFALGYITIQSFNRRPAEKSDATKDE